jgi:uncharacterized NAD(P)/FAD-binding protein YdhS
MILEEMIVKLRNVLIILLIPSVANFVHAMKKQKIKKETLETEINNFINRFLIHSQEEIINCMDLADNHSYGPTELVHYQAAWQMLKDKHRRKQLEHLSKLADLNKKQYHYGCDPEINKLVASMIASSQASSESQVSSKSSNSPTNIAFKDEQVQDLTLLESMEK